MKDVVDVSTGEIIDKSSLYYFFINKTSKSGYDFRDKINDLLDFCPIQEMNEGQLAKLEQLIFLVNGSNVSENTHIWMYRLLSKIALKRNDPDKAIEWLLACPPENASILRAIGELELARDNKIQALEYFEKALLLNPKIGVKKLVTTLKNSIYQSTVS